MLYERIKAAFNHSVNCVVSDISQYTVTPERDFTRSRKMGADKLISFLVSCGSSSTRIELLDFFGLQADSPSASAFNQQRAKLRPEALEAVFRHFNSAILADADSPLPFPCRGWLNLHLFQQAFLFFPGILCIRRTFCKRLLQHACECFL